MRWLIFFLLVCAALWYLRGIEEKPPPTAEESFIGDQVKALKKAEDFEKAYPEMDKQYQDRLEKQIEKDSGGG
jgi:hypothetical protein